jgi:lipoprotein-anchoring transpeptidase ErfK/SrfK
VVWRGLPLVLLLTVLAAPVARAQVEAGDGCGPAERSLRYRDLAFAAYAQGPVTAYAAPDRDALRTFARVNQNGVDMVFGVLGVKRDRDCGAAWYRVQLPMRPNGSVGWVRAADVALDPVRTRIEVDMSERRLWFFRDGKVAMEATVGVGAQGTPTPTGKYYVNQRFYTLDRGGPFGPGAIGISAFSPVLKDWAQGGPVAIHGTNLPSTVGRAASYGCIRIHNRVLRRLLWATETGSPVVIHR